MSGFNSHGVGAAACASADVASPMRAAAIKKVLIENCVIVILPTAETARALNLLVSHLEQITNANISSMPPSPHRVASQPSLPDFVISRSRLRDYVPVSGYKRSIAGNVMGMIRMSHVVKIGFGAALSFMTLVSLTLAS